MSEQAGSEYRRAAEVIKSRITPSDVGSMLTIGQIQKLTGAKYATARKAAERLETEGILEGRQGKGYLVRGVAEKVASERATIKSLSEEMSALRERVEKAGPGELLARVGRLEANLIDLYGKLGYNYPQDGADDDAKAN